MKFEERVAQLAMALHVVHELHDVVGAVTDVRDRVLLEQVALLP